MSAFEEPLSTGLHPAPSQLESDFHRLLRRATFELVVALGLPLLILLGSVAFLVYFTHWVDHSDLVLGQMNHAEDLLETMQSDFRGYHLLTQKDYLNDYTSAREQVDPALAGLERLAADKPGQEALAVQFQSEVDEWIKYVDGSFDHFGSKEGRLDAQAEIRTSQSLIGAALKTAKKFTDNEDELRKERYDLFRKSVVLTAIVLFLMAFIGIPVVLYRHRVVLKQVGGMYDTSLQAESNRATELEVTLRSIGDAVICTNQHGKIEFMNPVAEKLTGWKAAEALGRLLPEVYKILNEKTRAVVRDPVQRVLKENVIVGLSNHTVLRIKDGRELPIEDSAAPIRDADGKVGGVILVFHDVSVKRANELKLAREEWRSRNALAVGGAGSWAWDVHTGMVTGDMMLSKTFGIPLEDCEKGFPASRLLKAVNTQDQASLRTELWEAIRRNKIFNGEYRVTDGSGNEYWLQGRGRVERDGRGKAIRMFGFLIDITDRKRVEIALTESNENFRMFTAIVEMVVWTAAPSGELDYMNEKGVSYFGGDPGQDILGHAWFQYVHPNDLARAQRSWGESIKTGADFEIEMRLRSQAGEYRWFLSRGRCMRNAQGVITKWFGGAADIDDLKKAQQQALDANRAKDDFLAALSHELRNPLNPAMLVASAEAENQGLPEPVRESFDIILKNIEVEARLIDDLLDLTRISSGKLSLHNQMVDVQEIFMDALAGVEPDQLRKKIELTVDWNAEKNRVNGDPVRLRQIFWNILKNAVKFTPQEGRVNIKASNANLHVVIQVIDTGIGIKADELSRLFNPFA